MQGFGTVIRPLLKVMAKDILRQKKRLGGDFAVAFAVSRRESRDLLREQMGPDLVFIVLNLTKECMTERVEKRHPGDEGKIYVDLFNRMYDAYQPAGDDEENAYNVSVDGNMSPDDVVQNVINLIEKIEKR